MTSSTSAAADSSSATAPAQSASTPPSVVVPQPRATTPREGEQTINSDNKKEEESAQGEEEKRPAQQRPDEYANGEWDAEPFYYFSQPAGSSRQEQQQADGTWRKQKRGVIYKRRGESTEYECFQSHEGLIYRPGDQVFVESSREEPWMIGSVCAFRMKKRDQLLVKLLRYYRPLDVPELSFSLVTQERIEEGQFHATRQSHARELFSSDSTLLFHVSALRGKCTAKLVKDLRSALAEIDLADPDSFFHCLSYNQDSGRLSSVQMQIRVGSAFQAEVSSCSSSSLSDEPDRDELLYRPGYMCAETELKYVKAARTFRHFSLTNNKRITMLEKAARTGDLLFDDAITTLHRCKYNFSEGISTMQGNDAHLTSDSSFMSADDVKKFGKGIKTYGKNFNKINKELLPHHRREQLVAFYYLWKKSREATRPKPLSSAKRNQVIAAVGRRGKNGSGGTNGGTNGTRTAENGLPVGGMENGESGIPLDELMDYASASETEVEQQLEIVGSRACHHCYSSESKDWHHTGRDRLLMCTDCRIFYKKYGQLRPVDRPCTVPPCLLSRRSPSNAEDDENEEPQLASSRIRTRGAAAGRQQRPRRTPSSLDGDSLQKLRTPHRVSGGDDGPATAAESRRSTPLRNAKGRKRAHRAEEEQQSTPSSAAKPKRQKTKANSPATADSRSPSPPRQSKEKPKDGSEKQSLVLRKAGAGESTPPPPTRRSPYSSDASTVANSEGNSPQQPKREETDEFGTPQQQAQKKPVAKVEPLDNTSKLVDGGGVEPESCTGNGASSAGSDCVVEVEEGCAQDVGSLGVPTQVEVYRKTDGDLAKATILERRLQRASEVTCARTDIAYVEPRERTLFRQRKREEEKDKREQEQRNRQLQQQGNPQSRHQQVAGLIGAKKMEMPAEFVANGVGGAVATGAGATANPTMTMMNGLMYPTAAPHHPSSSTANGLVNGPSIAAAAAAGLLPSHHPMAVLTAGHTATAHQQQQIQQLALMQQQQQEAMQLAQMMGANPAQMQAMVMAMGGGAAGGPAAEGLNPQAAVQQQQLQQLQQMLIQAAMQEQQQQQKLQQQQQMELQRQQKQQQRQNSHLNGQHPHPSLANGIVHHHQKQQQHFTSPQSLAQQQKEQQNTSNALMLLNAQSLQQQQAAMFAFQQQQRAAPQPPPPTASAHPNAGIHRPPSHSQLMVQNAQPGQQQQTSIGVAMLAELAPQQLMALMSAGGLDPRMAEELRGHFLSQQQQQLAVAAATAQQQAQQQQLLAAVLSASGGLSGEQQMQMLAMMQQNGTANSHHNHAAQQQALSSQQQHMAQMAAFAALQQQQQQAHNAASVAQQQQQFQQQMELLRRMQQEPHR